MSWEPPQPTPDVVAIHAAIMPANSTLLTGSNVHDGQILLMGGDNHVKANNTGGTKNYNHAAVIDCKNPYSSIKHVDCPAWDLFCCGHAMRGDGHLVTAGGTAEFAQVKHTDVPDHWRHFHAHNHAAVFDGHAFHALPDTVPQPSTNPAVGGGHWYPTLVTLKTGEVYAFGGHPKGDDGRHNNNTPETLSFDGTPQWRGHDDLGSKFGFGGEPHSYPRMHLLKDGRIFISSKVPFDAGNSFNTQNIIVDPETSKIDASLPNLPNERYHGFHCCSVMLPLLPGDNYKEHILLSGGETSQLLDLSQLALGWRQVLRDVQTPRMTAMATLLPTGHVLMTGGAAGSGGEPENQSNTGQTPELYHPVFDKVNKKYGHGVGHWITIHAPAQKLRNYHSTALLMPDGRVWTAGGNGPGQPESPPDSTIQETMEIFSPPYPAGDRPMYVDSPLPQAPIIASFHANQCS